MDEILSVVYASCDLVLEVDVVWSERGKRREVVLGWLPEELRPGSRYTEAVLHVTPFVDAVKRNERIAMAEVRRALLAQRDRDVLASDYVHGKHAEYRSSMDHRDCFYDPHAHGPLVDLVVTDPPYERR